MEVEEKVPNKPSFNWIFFFNWIKFVVVVVLLIHGEREREREKPLECYENFI
jgi:hypothetical protein